MTSIFRTQVLNEYISYVRRYCMVLGTRNISISNCYTYLSPYSKIRCINSHVKSLHLSCKTNSKSFIEIENSHVHSWMECNSSYSSTICKKIEIEPYVNGSDLKHILAKIDGGSSAKEVFIAFRDISKLCNSYSLKISDPQLKTLREAFVLKCEEFEDSELLMSLKCLSLWPPTDSITEEPFYSLWKALDKVCVKRLKKWNVDMALLSADHWNLLNLARRSEYVPQCLKKISRRLDRLSPQQFVQVLFYINLCRKLPVSASTFEFSYTFENLCEKLSLEEMSIVAMGFFKSQTNIKNPQIGKILLSRLESCFQTVDPVLPSSIMLASLMKMARFCVHPTLDQEMQKTLDAMVPHINKISLLVCLHAVLMGTNIQLFHEPVTKAVCDRFIHEMKTARLKDIERLALALTMYNYDPRTDPCVYNAMVTEVRRRIEEAEKEGRKWIEMERHGECLLRFLGFISLREIFPLDIIDKAMDPDFITHVYGKSWEKVGREVLILDVNLEVCCPEYKKRRLDPKLRAFLTKKFRQKIQKETEPKKMSAANRLHADVLKVIKSLLGAEEKVISKQILPQFERADIVFCIDDNGVLQNPELPNSNTTVVKSPINCGQWHIFVPCGWNSFMKTSNQPLGTVVTKMKQLETLGFKPTLIPCFEWDVLRPFEKQDYLRRKIFS